MLGCMGLRFVCLCMLPRDLCIVVSEFMFSCSELWVCCMCLCNRFYMGLWDMCLVMADWLWIIMHLVFCFRDAEMIVKGISYFSEF